jgi:quercetin dioxygenase-like cupin family protein
MEIVMVQAKILYFINPAYAPKLTQIVGLETTILTGLHGEKMMMVLNATFPGFTVPLHAHPHEQIGMVYAGKAMLRIGEDERIVQKGDFYCIPANIPHKDICIGDEPFVMLDIFYPVREDFNKKLKQFTDLRGKLKNESSPSSNTGFLAHFGCLNVSRLAKPKNVIRNCLSYIKTVLCYLLLN